MSLFLKFNLILLLVFVVGLVPTGLVFGGLLEDNARQQILANAEIMMETAMAMRGYTVSEVRPLIAAQMDKTFLPQSVPAYSATQIFEALRKQHPEYTYKEATLNPSNPRNRAVDWETDLVAEFSRNPKRTEITGERDTPLGRSLYLAHPIRITNENCLTCHRTPEEAPPSMVKLYGDANGFGWKMNETIGAQIVSVPMSLPLESADRTWWTLMTALVTLLAAALGLLNVLLHFVVIRPVKRLSRLADDISRGNLEAEPMEVKGKDEVSVLARSFQRMRISLAQAMKMLGDE